MSIIDKSLITKNKIAPRVEIGLYCSRIMLMLSLSF